MPKNKSEFYDIYGFGIAVSGPLCKSFEKEFNFFKVGDLSDRPHLVVKPSKGPLPINALRGTKEGIKIPFENGDNEFLYTLNAPHDILINYSESLMNWPDKTFMHAGAVSKNKKIYVFTGKEHVGKTSLVLNLLQKGFDYIGDDWVIVGNNKAYPFPKTIHIFCYNLGDKKLTQALLGRREFFQKLKCKLFDSAYRLPCHRYFKILIDKYRPRFDASFEKICPEAKVGESADIEKIFYIERKDVAEPELKNDLSPEELATRMSFYNFYEKGSPLFREYSRYVERSGIRKNEMDNRINNDYQIMLDSFRNTKLIRLFLPLKINLLEENLEDFLL